jgi:hypothetical protein
MAILLWGLAAAAGEGFLVLHTVCSENQLKR